jgi:hypothetical protein
MKIFFKKIETCLDCPNLTRGGISTCHYDKKNPSEVCSFLDTTEWLRDKENIKDPLSIPDWCQLANFPNPFYSPYGGVSGTSGSAGIELL